ncbi:hypothetical protein OIO90_004271 [Microbotryomycetes sp. JL221]|nr:hypothetical protein OIO90_004271 [Microbotryomycetes sp. JL221]
MGNFPQFSLPAWPAFSFAPFYLLQALLLQPSVVVKFNRHTTLLQTVRALTGLTTLFFSIVAPFWWRIEPVQHAIGANFRYAIFSPYFILRSIEFAFVTSDLKRYQWIGFDQVQTVQLSPDQDTISTAQSSAINLETVTNGIDQKRQQQRHQTRINSLPTPPQSPVLRPTSQPSNASKGSKASQIAQDEMKATINDSLWTAFKDALHLVTTFRGVGYAFGPKPQALPPVYHASNLERFLLRSFKRLVRSHVISNLCTIIMVHRNDLVPQLIQNHTLVSHELAQSLSNILSYLSVGISLHAQMLIGFEGCKLFLASLSFILPKIFTFDTREWPDLFWMPFLPNNVTEFWSKHWHHLFRDPFTSVGFDPVNKLVGSCFGQTIGRVAGVFTVFGLSSWLHDQALYSARWNLNQPELTMSERWGAWWFFMAQAFAIVIEGIVVSLTKPPRRKLKGIGWTLWSYFWIVAVGCMAGRSWLALGLVKGMPPVQEWAWQRFVIPSFSLAPPPIFVKS